MASLLKRIKHKLSRPKNNHIPKKWLSSKSYGKRFDAHWYEVYESTVVSRVPPVNYSSHKTNLESKLCSEFPNLGVLELKNGRLIGENGWIVGQDDYLLPEHSWYGLNVDEIRVPQSWGKTNVLKGICLSLASDWAYVNYGHFLLDSLSRLHLFEEAGFTFSDVDYIYCPIPKLASAKRLLEQFGVPLNKCILNPFPENSGIQADIILAPSFPGVRRNYPDWVPIFLRRVLDQPLPAPSRKLYITRNSGTRKVVNEQAILAILNQYNFEIYDPTKHTNTPSDFAAASIVVGAHGAGLADLAFCQPGTPVLELMSSDHIYPYYCSLSQAAGLQYRYLVGSSLEERDASAFGPSPYDFQVDEQEFYGALTEAITLAN